MIFGNTNERQPPLQCGGCRSYVDTRETFTLSGWAKGYSLPDHEREGEEASTFRLRAVIVYVNGEKEEYDAPFCPNINAQTQGTVLCVDKSAGLWYDFQG